MPGKEHATSGELVYEPPKYLKGLPVYADTDQIVERTIERMMKATTPEELLANPDSGGLRDLTDSVITIVDVLGIMPSNLRDGDFYLVFEAAVGPDGAITTLTTGSPYAAGRIVKLFNEGWLPRKVRVVQLESASNPGQSSLWVVDVPQGSKEPAESPF